MHHALELVLDSGTDSAVRRTWELLGNAGIPNRMLDLGASPHLTLAVYTGLDVDRWRADAQSFFSTQAPLPITLASVGSFPGEEGVVFLAPTPTRALLDLHQTYHEATDAVQRTGHPYYLPGAWVPHCTVGFHLPPDQLPAAVELVRRMPLPLTGMLEGACLIEFEAGSSTPVRSCAEFRFTNAPDVKAT